MSRMVEERAGQVWRGRGGAEDVVPRGGRVLGLQRLPHLQVRLSWLGESSFDHTEPPFFLVSFRFVQVHSECG